MASPLLALFTRSVRADTRGQATYMARLGMGTFLFLFVLFFGLVDRWTGVSGKVFFTIVIILQSLAIALVGLSYFTSAIAEEKDEQTLGLLRMTSLNSLSILLGKSTSRLCGALLLLAGQIPFTIFAITLGGVSLRQIVAVYCALGAFTFLLCNLALLGSVLARGTAGAIAFCLLVLGGWFFSGWLFGLLYAGFGKELGLPLWSGRLATALSQATPMVRLHEALSTGFSGSPVGWQVASNLLGGVVCFLIAWIVFERFGDRAGSRIVLGPSSASPIERRPSHRRWLRPPRAWKNALVWKDFYFLCGGRAGLALRTIGYGGTLVTYLVTGDDSVATLTFIAFCIDSAAMAARIFRVELDRQTLGNLAGLPFTMREIAHRKALACVLAAAPGIVATLVMQIFTPAKTAMLTISGTPMTSGLAAAVLERISGWITLILLVHVVAWLSLSMKRAALPVGFLLTFFGGWILLGFCTLLAMMISAAFELGSGSPGVDLIGPFTAALLCLGVVAILRSLIRVQLEQLASAN
jgi:hypothetical protein